MTSDELDELKQVIINIDGRAVREKLYAAVDSLTSDLKQAREAFDSLYAKEHQRHAEAHRLTSEVEELRLDALAAKLLAGWLQEHTGNISELERARDVVRRELEFDAALAAQES